MKVLQPAGPDDNPPYDQQVTSVAIVPGTHDRQVIAAIGWHGTGNTEYNGFYQSNDGGLSFSKVTITGAIDASDQGRTTFAYSADGTKLYAIVQSISGLAGGDETSLQGIFVSTGSPASVAGPWVLIGDEHKLAASGSALPVGSGYGVGIQAWYNQDLAVDPSNPNHVYAGLEEVFESTDGGNTWNTASQYWNFGLACNPNCPQTTHPDQHAMMITDGKIVIGNDGGVYSRPLSDDQQYGGWTDLNSTLDSWQYYDARAGYLGNPGSGVGVWGGLQDNGTSFDFTGASQMIEPAGGDGFDVIAPPTNAATTMVGEYAYGLMYSTTDGGHTFDSYITPMCLGQEEAGLPGGPRPDCDPNSRFLTPLAADQNNPNTWVSGGEDVWITKAGWNTTCTVSSCSWQNLYDTGVGNVTTAVTSADNGQIIYDAWVTNGNPSPRSTAASPPTTAAPGTSSTSRACLTGTSPESPSTRATPRERGWCSTGTHGAGSRAAASVTYSRPRTAASPGPTSPEIFRTSRPTRSSRRTSNWPWPPTAGRTPRRQVRARTRAGTGSAPASRTRR